MNEESATQPQRDRLLKVFEFLKAYLDMRYPPVRDIRQQMRVLWLNDLPPHTSIEIFNHATQAAEGAEVEETILRITRPILTSCPLPPREIAEWLKVGWQEVENTAEHHLSRNQPEKDGRARIERFEDVAQRPTMFRRWQRERAEWQENERPARLALTVFQSVYEWYGINEREAERIELFAADGLLNCSAPDGEFNHQVLLQRLDLRFEPEKLPPQFSFVKREQPPELYEELLGALPEANYQQIAKCKDELKQTEFSPFGGDETEGFFRRLIYGVLPSEGDLLTPEGQPEGGKATIRRRPAIFMRQRRPGIGNVFDFVREDIATRTDFATSLLQIVGLAGITTQSPPQVSSSSTFGNEDTDVLLSKPANKEQLEIAQQLARRDCVLVQGPPGTGKTHTIANLLGHLLAQGKRVLVTAHTPKALGVLRQKVVRTLQPLCVSVLQNDKKSQEELQESVRRISVGLSGDAHLLERDSERFKRDRQLIIGQLSKVRSQLLDARQDEIRAVVFGGTAFRPIDAAKRIKEGTDSDAWIPSPVRLGDALPLSHAEIVALYQTNVRINLDDERELNVYRPEIASLATPNEFRGLVEELEALGAQNLRYREELWESSSVTNDLAEFDKMLSTAFKAIEFLRDCAPWEMEAVQAGRDGAKAKQVWTSLTGLIEDSWREVQECHELVMAHGPRVDDPRSPHELLPVIDEIINHIEAGKSFGLLTKLTKAHCHQLIAVVHVGNRTPVLTETKHFRAIRAFLRMKVIREELSERWQRQITTQGGPPTSELTDHPEKVCRGFVVQIHRCLDWHGATWSALESDFQRLGFRWPAYLQGTPPETGENAELRRLRSAVVGELETILKARAGWLRERQLKDVWLAWCAAIPETTAVEAVVTQRLRQALREGSPADYQKSYDDLVRLKNLEMDLQTRGSLLARLEGSAPAWASAVQNRHPFHARPEPPGDPLQAWQWRQLHDELERRASVSLSDLQQQIERLNQDLLEVTGHLAERLTWLSLIRRTTHEQKQALGAYAALRNKITKTGKGVRDADLRAAARREMTVAKGAVPVWIMPLNEVAETFDPRTTQFDVVIIDEASQCDPTAMFALYLGRQAIVVGDDEQVTPVTVGVEMEQVQRLVQTHLQGIPHKELYDGEFSIYEFAQIAFGGVIRLVEHFRCAPNIISFSNGLSYKGEIKPLRESSSIRLTPHVVHHRVEGGRIQNEDGNDAEAETIASLICAAIEQPEYASNDSGKPTSFGVVSLVGAGQAMKVDTILRNRIEPAEYLRRKILCGDAAQFQGDERDVMMLSVVDAPPAQPPLPLRQEGPKKIFKKRYNVAASRARDQMWVVHSLNHEVDLKPGDYRRQLIEHAIDPEAWERELKKQLEKTESVFEKRVLANLVTAHFIVQPQFQVGSYRIDLVVIGGGKRLAVECDGEKYHGPERLQEDMERQAILERLGWQFIRIRGSVFFRDEDRAMKPVFSRLEELGITPEASLRTIETPLDENRLVQRVIQRAQELRRVWREEAHSPLQSDTRPQVGTTRPTQSFTKPSQDSTELGKRPDATQSKQAVAQRVKIAPDDSNATGATETKFKALRDYVSVAKQKRNLGVLLISEISYVITELLPDQGKLPRQELVRDAANILEFEEIAFKRINEAIRGLEETKAICSDSNFVWRRPL